MKYALLYMFSGHIRMYIDLYFYAYMYAYMYVCLESCVCMQVSFMYVSRPVYIDGSQLM